MTVNVTPVMSKLNIQREIIQKLKLQKSAKISKKLMNNIKTFNEAYEQINAKIANVNAGGRQAFSYAGNPKRDKFTVVDGNSESGVKVFSGIDAVATFGNAVAKSLSEIK